MSSKPVVAPTREHRDARKRELLDEIAFLTDEQDGIKAEVDRRKEELLLLMSQDGDRAVEHEDVAQATFSQRRSFEIHDPAALARMFSKDQLVEQVKVSAAFFDAADREGYRIREAVTVGVSESLSVLRAKTNNAKTIRKANIDESRKKADAKVIALRAKLRQF